MGKYLLYRIFYNDEIVYVGRTSQPLQDRIRGHLFKKPMLREIDIEKVSQIEFTELKSQADMYLYEIYFINLWHPKLNRDDKARDDLSISLPDLPWFPFHTSLWDKWKREIEEINREEQQKRNLKEEKYSAIACLRRQLKSGEITEKEYWEKRDEIEQW